MRFLLQLVIAIWGFTVCRAVDQTVFNSPGFQNDIVVRVEGDFSNPLAKGLIPYLEASNFDIWKATSEYMHVRLQNNRLDQLRSLLDKVHVNPTNPYEITTLFNSEQLSFLIDSTYKSGASPQPPPPTFESTNGKQFNTTSFNNGPDDFHSSFHTYESISAFLQYLSSEYPDYATLFSIGKSPEGREIYGLRVAAPINPNPRYSKLGMVLTAGQHAREWIAPAANLFMIHTMLSALSNNPPSPFVEEIFEDWEISFIPVVNVDGYAYTWETDRLWRKNRQPVADDCIGIDLNRNWGYNWKPQLWPNPCSEAYPGEGPFESSEIRLLRDYILNNPYKNFHAFIDLHSYGQLVMYPWSNTCEPPPHAENLFEGALGAARAIRYSHGQPYRAGSICELSYISSGSSVDWTYGEANLKWSYSIESRDLGQYAFLVPANEIRPAGEETFAALLSLASFIMEHDRGYDPKSSLPI